MYFNKEIIFLRKGNTRENDGTSINLKNRRYLIRRLNNDINDYLNNLIKIKKIDKKKLDQTVDKLYSRNFRPWIVENKIFFNEILIDKKLKNKLINRISLISKIQFLLIEYIPTFILRELIKIKRKII